MDGATIFALSSGAPPAAIAVIRISGAGAGAALVALHGRLPAPRHATLGWLRAPGSRERLDRALLLWFPGPRTATGEDLAELHVHGGRAVTRAVLDALGGLAGLRAAEPGEFTRRAFANGVIDLAEAEGLADLIAAETDGQRRNAQRLAGGALSRRVAAWQDRILALAARVEATLDFSDEADVPDDGGDIAAAAARIAAEMEKLLDGVTAERLRDGIRVVLAGPPNAGKSTLLNAMAGREAAITAPVPGTTRDVVEVPLAIAGIPFLLADTAGIRDAGDDPVERIGVDRAVAAAAAADILLWLGDPDAAPQHRCVLRLHARCDLPPRRLAPAAADLAVSGATGEGIPELMARLADLGDGMMPEGGEVALNRRQRATIGDCAASLRQVGVEGDPILVAEHFRVARAALDRLTGRAGTEDMLDALFGNFCIGK